MRTRQQLKTSLSHKLTEQLGVSTQLGALGVSVAGNLHRLSATTHHSRGHSVREQVGAGALTQQIHHFLRATNVTTASPTQGLTQGTGQNVYAPAHP